MFQCFLLLKECLFVLLDLELHLLVLVLILFCLLVNLLPGLAYFLELEVGLGGLHRLLCLLLWLSLGHCRVHDDIEVIVAALQTVGHII